MGTYAFLKTVLYSLSQAAIRYGGRIKICFNCTKKPGGEDYQTPSFVARPSIDPARAVRTRRGLLHLARRDTAALRPPS